MTSVVTSVALASPAERAVAQQVPAERTAPSVETSSIVVHPGQSIRIEAAGAAFLEAAIGSGALVTVPGELTAPSVEGDHWLVSVARNRAGVASEPVWTRVRVDATPPDLDFAFEPPPVERAGQRYLPPGAFVRLEARDAVAGVDATRLDAGGRNATGGTEVRLELPQEDGEVAIAATARDRVGNSRDTATTVWVDAIAPTIELSLTGPMTTLGARRVVGPSATIELAATDSGSGVANSERSLDGVRVEGGRRGGGLAAGVHRAEALVSDRVANQQLEVLEFTVDSKPPSLSFTVTAEREAERDGVNYYLPPVEVQAYARDDLAGVARFEQSTDGSTWSPVGAGWSGSGETLWLRARDRVANESRLEARWKIDRDPPALFLVDDSGTRHPAGAEVEVATGSELRFEAVDEGAGVERLESTFRWRGWFIENSFAVRDGLVLANAGRYFVFARAEDRLGNVQAARWPVRAVRRTGERP